MALEEPTTITVHLFWHMHPLCTVLGWNGLSTIGKHNGLDFRGNHYHVACGENVGVKFCKELNWKEMGSSICKGYMDFYLHFCFVAARPNFNDKFLENTLSNESDFYHFIVINFVLNSSPPHPHPHPNTPPTHPPTPHYLNQCWFIVNWTHGNKFQWNLNLNFIIFIRGDAFENVVSQNGGHFVQGRCVNILMHVCISELGTH